MYQQIEIRYGLGQDKLQRYCEILRAMFSDQVAWIRDRSHLRRVAERNGRDSVAVAAAATALADASP